MADVNFQLTHVKKFPSWQPTLKEKANMSGEASRSRSKKAAAAKSGKQGQNQAAANQKSTASKKKSKDRKMQRSSTCSRLAFWVLVALIGVTAATYKLHPDKFQQVYDNLPPQVSLIAL